MKEEKNKRIVDLSDSEFLSLLYSERDRAHALNQVPGWSRWAILGAWVTVLCAAYVVLRDNHPLNDMKVLYLTSSFLAFFFTSSSFFRLLQTWKSVDYSRVKFLKEVLPTIQLFFVFFCSIIISVWIFLFDTVNIVFWLWIALFLVYLVALIIVLFVKDAIVPAFYFDTMFPWKKVNIFFESLLSALYLSIFNFSFRRVSSSFFTSEFELSICLASLIALAFLFFRIRSNDDEVKRIDGVIEDFLYRGLSKKEAFQRISINRWGYTVMDACSNELNDIQIKLEECNTDLTELGSIEATVKNSDVSLDQIGVYLAQMKDISMRQKEALEHSKKLVKKLKQVLAAAPSLNNEPGFLSVVQTGEDILLRINDGTTQVSRIIELVRARHNQIKAELLSTREDIDQSLSTE